MAQNMADMRAQGGAQGTESMNGPGEAPNRRPESSSRAILQRALRWVPLDPRAWVGHPVRLHPVRPVRPPLPPHRVPPVVRRCRARCSARYRIQGGQVKPRIVSQSQIQKSGK